MPQSFDKRFEGREPGVVDEIKLFGEQEFCKHEGISGYALQKWFQKQRGCEGDSIFNYGGFDHRISDLPLMKQIALAIQAERTGHQNWVAKCETRLEEKEQRIKKLEEQLRYYKTAEYRDLKPLFNLCFQPIEQRPLGEQSLKL